MNAAADITTIKGVGDSLAVKFKKVGIETVADLLENVPRRYDDYSSIIRVSQIKPGPVTIKVKLSRIKSRYSRKGLHITEALATDSSGSVQIIWFNQPYRASALKEDTEYFVSGEFGSNYKYFAITNPACELVSAFPVNTARLVPVYRLTKGLGVTQVRKAVKNAFLNTDIKESLPTWIIDELGLMSKKDSLFQMHFPENVEKLAKAKARIGFEEVFELTLASELNKQEFASNKALKVPFDEQLTKNFVEKLPFKLTNHQRKSAWEIFQDMQSGKPMNRLVEGDVGSGKTVVAVMAALGAINAGYQVAFMAPTELLASQHANNLSSLLGNVGQDKSLVFLSGSMSKKQKDIAYKAIKSSEAKLVVGTHAIFQKGVEFENLGLIIVDEQHRFGVAQRKALQAKASEMPHVLNLTATPIPRSLALTLYGEMDVSIISEMPKGRKMVETFLEIPENRERIYQKVTQQLDNGKQAFVVCPQIEDQEDKISVEKIYKLLNKSYLKDYNNSLLHGKMKSEEKETIMKKFVEGETQVLVSTTVIEVGVDVPNATMMVIEGADKFGLAQLHQLRGRVGRGSEKSFCYLVMSSNDQPTQRLKILEYENNGFKLAEYDLELRGPGAIYGTAQHGELDLRVAKLTDVKLIKLARSTAVEFIKRGDNLIKYPELKKRVNALRTINNLN